MRLSRLIPLPMVAVALAACGGNSGTPTEPSIKANVTYQGIFVSGLERGTVTLVSSSPATGSISVNGKAAVALTGSFNTTTSTFSLTGSGYTVAGQAGTSNAPAGSPGLSAPALASSADGTLSGTVTGPDITGTATMAAAETGSGVTTTRYCGVHMGDDSGMLDVILMGNVGVATRAGMGGGFVLSGTVAGTKVTLSVTGLEPGSGRQNTVTANLTLAGTTLSGSASSTLYPAEVVTITTSSTACQSVPQSGPYTSYVGWVWNNGYTGLLTLVPGSPATGTLAWNGGAPVALTGTYNATTGAFSMTGGGTTITATATEGTLSGSASGLPPTTSNGAVRGLGSSAATPVTRYCGSLSGGMSGKVIFGQAGSVLAGIVVYGTTTLVLSGMNGGAWVYLPAGTQMFMAGTGSPGTYNGTWGHVNDTVGNWSATGGC